MNQDTTQQVVSVALQIAFIVVPLLLGTAATWLTRLIGQNVKDKGMRDFALGAVQAAEQKIAIKSNRYMYAADLIHQRFPALPAPQVEMLIEASVHTLKQSLATALTQVDSIHYPSVESTGPVTTVVQAVDPKAVEREVFRVFSTAFSSFWPAGGGVAPPVPLATETSSEAPAPAPADQPAPPQT